MEVFQSEAKKFSNVKWLGEISYASFGLGSTAHLNMEMLQQMAGIRLNHIQYKGSAPAMVDVAGGHVAMMFNSTGGVLPQLKSGKLRLIAMGSKARLPQYPDIPTVAEAAAAGDDPALPDA